MTLPLVEKLRPLQPLHFARMFAICFLFLSACQAKGEIATDEQLVLLFGEKPPFSDGPDLQISKKTVDCVRLLSGLDEQLYKDAPAEMLGRVKTECRMPLDARVRDTKHNPVGLTLRDIEDKVFAERITALKQRIDTQLKAKAEAAREKERAEKNVRIKDALANAEKDAAQFAGTLETQLHDIDGLCDNWKKLKEQLAKGDKNSKYRFRFTPNPCTQTFRENVQRQVARTTTRLAEAKAKQDSELSEFSIPNLSYISSFYESLSSLKEEVKAMQAMTAKVN